MLRSCVIYLKIIGMITCLSLSSLTTKVITLSSKWLRMKLFMGEDTDLLSNSLKLLNWIDRTVINSSSYGEGESDSREVENSEESSEILH